ncbi:hypothetical protein WL29_23305 [Burkholderia ubonensis]|uniref:Uncharacterized protein n=1 Tax=Burkholderia ubonensis TaxID=101571 RepID=A0A119HFQ0_9BURK|nr:hypothetical protein [Burkholderia ubonensis]KWA84287.1 hypothetical protein WL29_23305 [Burkholderia ubonensis]
MGSFNIKCGVSGQVIAEREKCRVMVILQQATYSPAQVVYRDEAHSLYGVRNSGGIDSLWSPMTGFLSGTYADYSKVTLDATPENQAILAEFFNGLYKEVALTQASERDPAFDFKALVLEKAPKLHTALAKQTHPLDSLPARELDLDEAMKLWDALQKATIHDRVFCVNGNKVLRPLKIAAVHEVTFHRLVALAESIRMYDESTYARNDYFTRAFSNLKEELADVTCNDMKRFVRKDLFRDTLRMGMPSKLSHSLLWAFRRTLDVGVDAVADKGEPVSYFLEVCKGLLDGLYALKGIDRLNVQLSPIEYAGQDYNNATGKLYAEFVAGASDEICAARRAEYGDDDMDDDGLTEN